MKGNEKQRQCYKKKAREDKKREEERAMEGC